MHGRRWLPEPPRRSPFSLQQRWPGWQMASFPCWSLPSLRPAWKRPVTRGPCILFLCMGRMSSLVKSRSHVGGHTCRCCWNSMPSSSVSVALSCCCGAGQIIHIVDGKHIRTRSCGCCAFKFTRVPTAPPAAYPQSTHHLVGTLCSGLLIVLHSGCLKHWSILDSMDRCEDTQICGISWFIDGRSLATSVPEPITLRLL